MNIKSSPFIKLGFISLLIIILMMPTSIIKDLISERQSLQFHAINEVSQKWAFQQKIIGPYIAIPYDLQTIVYNTKTGKNENQKSTDWIYILPESLIINGNVIPEKRYRGIYEIIVYESQLALSGKFDFGVINDLGISAKNIHFDKAIFNLGISDLKGIQGELTLLFNEKTYSMNAGVSDDRICSMGVNSVIKIKKDARSSNFQIKFSLNGSQQLQFVPVGKETLVNITSNYTTPSFIGNFLPRERNVDEKGFTATWNISHLNRNFPQIWTTNSKRLVDSAFGVALLLNVNNYTKSFRVIKYAILVLVLTFLCFFFVEVLKKINIHPIQYSLVGTALVVFYSLLISISEHLMFNIAYAIAAICTILLIISYSWTIIKSKILAMFLGFLLFLIYSFIFLLIQLEDYALLVGNIGLFLIVATVMYFSRKIDWYQIRLAKKK